nr:hypothetical protein GCM10020092_033940 [Actinoplanes digitatis]
MAAANRAGDIGQGGQPSLDRLAFRLDRGQPALPLGDPVAGRVRLRLLAGHLLGVRAAQCGQDPGQRNALQPLDVAELAGPALPQLGHGGRELGVPPVQLGVPAPERLGLPEQPGKLDEARFDVLDHANHLSRSGQVDVQRDGAAEDYSVALRVLRVSRDAGGCPMVEADTELVTYDRGPLAARMGARALASAEGQFDLRRGVRAEAKAEISTSLDATLGATPGFTASLHAQLAAAGRAAFAAQLDVYGLFAEVALVAEARARIRGDIGLDGAALMAAMAVQLPPALFRLEPR